MYEDHEKHNEKRKAYVKDQISIQKRLMDFLNSPTANEPLEYLKGDEEEPSSPGKGQSSPQRSPSIKMSEKSRKVLDLKSPQNEKIEDGKTPTSLVRQKAPPLPIRDGSPRQQDQATGRIKITNRTAPTRDSTGRPVTAKQV